MGNHQKQFLWGKALTTSWPSTAQLQRWNHITRAVLAQWVRPWATQAPPHVAYPAHALHSRPGAGFTMPDCVAALEDMHQALQRETAQRQELERAIHGTRKPLTASGPSTTGCTVRQRLAVINRCWICLSAA